MSDHPKQGKTALVLLHGIGEQRPMETLRGFISGVFGEPGTSKPDRLADSFEVRRLNLGEPYYTDCYELYWAHHMHSSNVTHIAKWLWRLSAPKPARLREQAAHLGGQLYVRIRWLLRWLLPVLVILGLGFTQILGYMDAPDSVLGWLGILALSGIVVLFLWLLNDRMVEVVADAARYLDNAPANVGIRQAIRSDCVRFLERLLDRKKRDEKTKELVPEYSRIILVGHSLGSVIAYDALRFLWAGMEPHAAVARYTDDVQEQLARLHSNKPGPSEDSPPGSGPANDSQPDPQRKLFAKLVPGENPWPWWRISDLITLGSPLTHAPLLLARTRYDFVMLQEQRELPTCPPQPDRKQPDEHSRGGEPESSEPSYCGWRDKDDNERFSLHHAAPFAVVRWTNLYFPSDPIGGPLSPVFGERIDDVALSDAPHRTWRDHVCYWRVENKCGSNEVRDKILGLISG